MSETRWGCFETDASIHVMPLVDGGVGGEAETSAHTTDADCFCEPNVDPETFVHPRCLWIHNHPEDVPLDLSLTRAWVLDEMEEIS